MPKVTIDGKEIEVPAGSTVLQACELAGKEIPRFCYHERLSIAGNCRMCLVQIEGGPPKPAASCAMPVAEGMKVHTDSPMVKKAREGVMEFLLINHPLDCPICDQGGECDLQDQAMAYGRDHGCYDEHKRAVKDKYMGPLIKTHMTRCIHCTRCIRFSTEVAGIEELGATGRGEHMEVGTYIEKALTSELSGNMIDLCPVGALTAKPYAFKARSWELRHTETIDVLDAVGSNIRVDYIGRQVMRVLPRLNEDINEEWIADKTRFAPTDGLLVQRLDRPMIRMNGRLTVVSWSEAITYVAQKMRQVTPNKIAAISGDLTDVETMVVAKEWLQNFGVTHLDCRQDNTKLQADAPRCSYLFNTGIASIEQADLCLLIGTNPRHEAPIINARIRKAYLHNALSVGLIGASCDLTYPVEYLGDSIEKLHLILQGTHPFVKRIEQAKKPMLILGQGALKRQDGEVIWGLARRVAEKFGFIRNEWNGFNVLHTAAARVGGLDVGFVPLGERAYTTEQIITGTRSGDIECLFLLGADEMDISQLGEQTFVVYIGHHGDRGAHRADVILPGAAYTEKEASYVNTEGRLQYARMVVPPPGESKSDWCVLLQLNQETGGTLPYSDLGSLREHMRNHYTRLYEGVNNTYHGDFGLQGKWLSDPLKPYLTNYYMTDPISRNSRVMAECTSILHDSKTPKEAA
jgi:NADH-quinone oxidoreductase subunit G